MLTNMFKIAWRNAIRHKQFSILNLLGLTVGITASIMIALYVIDQSRFDNFHEKADRIYRVNQPLIWGDWNEEFASTGPNVAIALRTDIPEFEEVTRVHTPGNVVVNYQDNQNGVISFTETKAFVAEENIFRIFDFQSLEGSLENALSLPGSIVITKSTAEKYFGTESPLGQTLNVIQGKDTKAFQVTAVLENIPQNSHIQFEMLMSMSSFDHIRQRQHQWIWTTFVTYALATPETDMQQLEAKIQSIPPKWAKSEINNVFGMTFDQYVNGKSWKLTLQPLSEVYINSPASGNRLGPSGNILYIKIFAAIGVLILILCSINFMNLSTAKSANRAKEVGIRKVLGSDKKSLIRQFIFESILYVGISTIISLMVTELFLDAFNQVANTQLSLQLILGNRNLIALIISFVFVLGIAAGSYPAFYLSSFSPIKVLKGKLSNGLKGSALRNTLVIVQFTISIALIISTFFVQKQLNYVSQKDLGFDQENILQIHNIQLLEDQQRETLQTLLAANPTFEEVGISDMLPPNVWNEDKYRAFVEESQPVTLNRLRADEAYLRLLNPELIAGRKFEENRGNESYKVILNESAVKALGWEYPFNPNNSPIGQQITFPNSNKGLFELIGVVKDFNFNSVRFEISPLLIIHNDNDLMWESGQYFISTRINSKTISNKSELSKVLTEVEAAIESIDPSIPFEYSFMDQEFEASFRTEQRMGSVLNIFTGTALSIACIGLFGLSAFASEQRRKELGIRKVLGASASKIVISFTKEFSMLIVASIIIASPMAYYFTNEWLSDFSYKTPIEPWVFLLVGLLSIAIAWLTIGVHSLNAAKQNPVDVLRNE